MKNSINGGRNHLILLGLISLMIFLKVNHIIVLGNPLVNLRLNFVIYLILILLFINSFWLRRSWLKALSITLSGLFCFVGLIYIFFFTLDDIDSIKRNGKDPGVECIREISIDKTKIKAYRTNGGATTDFGIVVREEKELFLGVLLTNTLYSEYHRDTVILKSNDKTLLILDRELNVVKKKDYK
jgi:hypothetical protein